MSQIRLLKEQMMAEESSTDTPSSALLNKANIWDISPLIGFRGMDAKELWDSIAHDPKQIIEEVS